jgi:Lysyl oxidase
MGTRLRAVVRWASLGALALAVALVALSGMPGVGAQHAGAVTPLVPNLTPLQASDLRNEVIGIDTYIRFTTTSWNNGAGPLELRPAGLVDDNGTTKQRVNQRVYNSDGSWEDRLAGFFEYHPDHSHIHFNGYAEYRLKSLAGTAADRVGAKVSFCIIDTTRMSTRLPGAPKKAVYTTCSATRQGMSVGWGDQYRYGLEGQSLKTTGLPDGAYELRITIDPQNALLEANEGDNVSTRIINLVGGRVQ